MEVSGLGTIQVRKVGELKPYQGNPRKIPERAVEMVAESLRRFGWQQPIVVDKDDVIVAGHTRLLAAQSLGARAVPVVVADQLTGEEITALRIADNRLHDFTAWDYPELITELDLLPDEFADVLGLQDWQAIIDQYEEGPTDLDPPEDSGLFGLVVVFQDKEHAEAAREYLTRGVSGVLDVKFKG